MFKKKAASAMRSFVMFTGMTIPQMAQKIDEGADLDLYLYAESKTRFGVSIQVGETTYTINMVPDKWRNAETGAYVDRNGKPMIKGHVEVRNNYATGNRVMHWYFVKSKNQGWHHMKAHLHSLLIQLFAPHLKSEVLVVNVIDDLKWRQFAHGDVAAGLLDNDVNKMEMSWISQLPGKMGEATMICSNVEKA